MINSYGGNKGVTYKVKNKYDADWLLKFTRGSPDAGNGINSTTSTLVGQQQIIFSANTSAGTSPTFDSATVQGVITFRVAYRCVVIGNNAQSQLGIDP